MNKYIYGPVPSRRLGKSLGINNIPYKVCSYNCVYCQIGEVPQQVIKLKQFYNTNEVIKAVEEKLASLSKSEMPDYLSLVPDGEPTLDMNLSSLIDGLKQFSIPIAVISNASMLATLTNAYGIFTDNGIKSEFLTGYEGNEFSSTSNFENDIMSITAVHPMREDAVYKLLESCNTNKYELTKLIESAKIKVTQYGGHNFYSREFNRY